MKVLVVVLSFFMAVTCLPGLASASTYGGSTFGSGSYSPTSTPTPVPGSSSSTSTSKDSSCTDTAPISPPKLFQIDRRGGSATLFFEPAGHPYNHYVIAYGYAQGDDRFNAEYSISNSTGAITHTINHLSPQQTYYFRVRAGHGCAVGDWSTTIRATGGNRRFYPSLSIFTPVYELGRSLRYELSDRKVSTPTKQSTQPSPQKESIKQQTSSAKPQVEQPQNTSFWEKVVGFVSGLFGR